ncbi:HNH endonuclease signature motif containing protein, partial [Microbacterium sp. 22242]
MSSSSGTVVDPVDPVMVLRMLGESLVVTEASIVQLQALREAHLGVAQHLAEDLAARSSGSGVVRGEAVDLAARSVAAELAGVLRMSDRVVQGRMARAGDLVARFPQTVRAFSEARINAAHVRVIQDAGARLDDDAVRAGFERLAVAACVGETPHRARRVVERVAERLCPRGL